MHRQLNQKMTTPKSATQLLKLNKQKISTLLLNQLYHQFEFDCLELLSCTFDSPIQLDTFTNLKELLITCPTSLVEISSLPPQLEKFILYLSRESSIITPQERGLDIQHGDLLDGQLMDSSSREITHSVSTTGCTSLKYLEVTCNSHYRGYFKVDLFGSIKLTTFIWNARPEQGILSCCTSSPLEWTLEFENVFIYKNFRYLENGEECRLIDRYNNYIKCH